MRLIFQIAWAKPEGFRLLFSGVATVKEGVSVFLNIVSDRRYARVELLLYLGARARAAILLRVLRGRNFLLLEGSSCFSATAFYRVAVGFFIRVVTWF